jgi:hypothetical protein
MFQSVSDFIDDFREVFEKPFSKNVLEEMDFHSCFLNDIGTYAFTIFQGFREGFWPFGIRANLLLFAFHGLSETEDSSGGNRPFLNFLISSIYPFFGSKKAKGYIIPCVNAFCALGNVDSC